MQGTDDTIGRSNGQLKDLREVVPHLRSKGIVGEDVVLGLPIRAEMTLGEEL